jgi:hypothetical protein
MAITLTPKQFKSLFGAKALADKPKRKSTVPSVPKKSGPELKYEQHLWELKLCGQVLEYKFQPRAFVLEQHEKDSAGRQDEEVQGYIQARLLGAVCRQSDRVRRGQRAETSSDENRAKFARPIFPCRTRF